MVELAQQASNSGRQFEHARRNLFRKPAHGEAFSAGSPILFPKHLHGGTAYILTYTIYVIDFFTNLLYYMRTLTDEGQEIPFS